MLHLLSQVLRVPDLLTGDYLILGLLLRDRFRNFKHHQLTSLANLVRALQALNFVAGALDFLELLGYFFLPHELDIIPIVANIYLAIMIDTGLLW